MDQLPHNPDFAPSDSKSVDPLRSIWLATNLQQTLTQIKLSLPGYRHLMQICSMPWQNKQFNVNSKYMEV
jgi:hypothetical protein